MSTVPPPESIANDAETADNGEMDEFADASSESLPKEDLSLLIDRTPAWMRWPAGTFGVASLIGVIYWVYSVTPLEESDLWAHVAYGQWIVANGVPDTEPLMPLCEGMPMPAVDWLWDVSAYGLATSLGPQGLKFLAAAPIALALIVLAVGVYRRSWSTAWTAVAVAACVFILHKQLFIRPQLMGLALFCAVWTVAREGRRWPSLVLIGLLFAVWSNVHGSWPVGLALLTAMVVGRGLDLLRRTGVARSLLHDRTIRRLFVMLEVAAVAVLVNPDGWAIYPGVWSILTNVNCESLIEWQPLTLKMKQGQALACVVAVLILLYRVSPRRASWTEGLVLLTLSAATLSTSRFIVWLAPLVAYYLALHGSATWRMWRRRPVERPEGRGLWAAASLGVLWIAFALAPQYRAMTGADRPGFDDMSRLSRIVSSDTPLGAIEYLRENPPTGLVFNDLGFGDSLLWFGPKGLKLFVHSHAHLTPRTVWFDYFEIARGSASKARLDRYGVTTAVLHAVHGKSLARQLVEDGKWQRVYEDSLAMVLNRTSPVGVPEQATDEQ